jgi:hypothetical protein
VSTGPIAELLYGRISADAAAWLAAALPDVGQGAERLWSRWSAVGRRLGRATLDLTAEDDRQLRAAGASFLPRGWGADECGRALLLLAALVAVPAGAQVALVDELYRTGETRERQAVLRTLAYLPEPARFTDIGVEAVRANVLSELEALACENPFPARHFSELAFNQLVMKCLFNGIAVGRIEGLEGRRSAELARMVTAFASERRAAGRPVPEDVAVILDGRS